MLEMRPARAQFAQISNTLEACHFFANELLTLGLRPAAGEGLVKQALQVVAPAAVLVNLVEEPEVTRRQAAVDEHHLALQVLQHLGLQLALCRQQGQGLGPVDVNGRVAWHAINSKPRLNSSRFF